MYEDSEAFMMGVGGGGGGGGEGVRGGGEGKLALRKDDMGM